MMWVFLAWETSGQVLERTPLMRPRSQALLGSAPLPGSSFKRMPLEQWSPASIRHGLLMPFVFLEDSSLGGILMEGLTLTQCVLSTSSPPPPSITTLPLS